MKATGVLAVLAGTLSFAAALTIDVSPPDPDKILLPRVPKVLDAGLSGFPELPAVSSVIDDSSATRSSIGARASKLQQQMKALQLRNAARLQRQKVIFEKKLRDQEENNVQVVKENVELAKEVLHLQTENHALFTQARELQKDNTLRQQQLKLFHWQVSTSQALLANTMETAGEGEANEIEVPSDDLSDSADTDDEQAPSFLSIKQSSSKEGNDSDEDAPESLPNSVFDDDAPASLLVMLNANIKDMQGQGKKGEYKLKEMFLTHFRAGTKRHKALLAQQDVLKSTIKTFADYHNRLEIDVNRLKATHSNLSKSLQFASLLVKKVSQLGASQP